MKRLLLTLAATVPIALTALASSADAASSYSNCTALNGVYPHGVGKPGARDSTSGKPVTTFTRSSKLYNANRSKDRDGDGIACEKK